MGFCTEAPDEPGPMSQLDPNDFPGDLEPPVFTPIAQKFADQSNGFLANLDLAYSALKIEQAIDLGTLLGGDSGTGSLASIFSAPAPTVTPIGAAPPPPTSSTKYALTIKVTNAATGGTVQGATVRIWQYSGNDPALQTDGAGAVTFNVWASQYINVFVDVDGYAPGRASLLVTQDTLIEVPLLPSTLDTAGTGTAAAAALAQLEQQIGDIRNRALNLLTYAGGNPNP